METGHIGYKGCLPNFDVIVLVYQYTDSVIMLTHQEYAYKYVAEKKQKKLKHDEKYTKTFQKSYEKLVHTQKTQVTLFIMS